MGRRVGQGLFEPLLASRQCIPFVRDGTRYEYVAPFRDDFAFYRDVYLYKHVSIRYM